jgi:tetratricopeptide (TPR) repeat protein
MQTKIKWFKEVLELEPASKVFFPLARLYFEDGQLEEAAATLKGGLERNPEHLEARFLLVEVLSALGRSNETTGEVETLTSVLSAYPAFWKAWAESGASRTKDSALALSFLAADFQGNSISWSQVIERGLDSLYVQPGTAAPREEAQDADGEDFDDDVDVVAEAEAAGLPEATIVAETLAAAADTEGSVAPPQVSPRPSVVEPREDETQEEATLRTRTMANLLAEQGDYRGAVEIYQELLTVCDDETDRAEIEDTIAGLKKRIRKGPSKGASAEEQMPPAELPGKEKLLGTLEALAERLEARATH